MWRCKIILSALIDFLSVVRLKLYYHDYIFPWISLGTEEGLVGLDLFNYDTCPSGHISRPTNLNVIQRCFHSLNKLLKANYIVQSRG